MEANEERTLAALRPYRREFFDLDQARQLIGTWAAHYNTARPHSSLGYKTPTAYAEQLTASTGAKPAEALVAAG